MKLSRILVTFAIAASLTSVSLADNETPVAIKDLPAAVTKAILAKYPKAELISATKEVEKGKTEYEVKIKTADGKTLEVEVDEKNNVTEGDD